VANTLAYYDTATITAVKSFLAQARLAEQRNKLLPEFFTQADCQGFVKRKQFYQSR
jgi:hypothetical protein